MTNSARLQNKFAFITGASRGIGRAVAERFAAEGATVAVNHLDDRAAAAETLERLRQVSTAQGHGEKPHLDAEADVADRGAVHKALEATIARWGRIDIAVNNAGIQAPSPSDDLDYQAFDRIVAVNLVGAANVASFVAKHLRETRRRGVIINTTSVHELIPKPTYLAYSVSKGGMANLTRTMALELAASGIRVNSVAPGAILTDINNAWRHDPQKRKEVESHIPMGYAAEPAEIAPAYVFLASDDSAYMTGQTMFLCGGLTLYPEFKENWSS